MVSLVCHPILIGWMAGWTCLKSLLLSDHMLVCMQALL